MHAHTHGYTDIWNLCKFALGGLGERLYLYWNKNQILLSRFMYPGITDLN